MMLFVQIRLALSRASAKLVSQVMETQVVLVSLQTYCQPILVVIFLGNNFISPEKFLGTGSPELLWPRHCDRALFQVFGKLTIEVVTNCPRLIHKKSNAVTKK